MEFQNLGPNEILKEVTGIVEEIIPDSDPEEKVVENSQEPVKAQRKLT